MNPGSVLSMQCSSEFDKPTINLLEELLSKDFSQLEFSSTFIPSFMGRWVFCSAAPL